MATFQSLSFCEHYTYLKVDLIILHTRQAEFTGLVKDDVKEPTFSYDGEDKQDTTLGYVRAARILKF